MTTPTLHRERETPAPIVVRHAHDAHRLLSMADALGMPMPYAITIMDHSTTRLHFREWEYAAWLGWLDGEVRSEKIFGETRHLTTTGRKGEVHVELVCVMTLDGDAA